MLNLRPATREKTGFFDRFLRYDIHRDATPIGTLNYDPRQVQAEIALATAQYNVARLSNRPDERAYQAVFRRMNGGDKPVNPIILTDADGAALAQAEKLRSRRAITYEDEHFMMRRPSIFSRQCHLYAADSETSLGSIGRDRLFTRQLTMNLPERFPPAFQVFLAVLMLTIMLESISVRA